MENAQLMKGILEGCVLSIIARGETYGYEIMQILNDTGFVDLQEGTLYPILTRLEKKGCISCRKEKSPLGPIRKYFSVTQSGKKELDDFKKSYSAIASTAHNLLFSEDEKKK